MQPAERTQVDGLGDLYSDLNGLDCSDSPDMARQEFKDEADINKLLARYGVNAPQRQGPLFNEQDYDMDLQQALGAIADAKRAHAGMPTSLRDRYPTWQSLLNGLESGQFRIDLDARPKATEHPTSPPTG